MQSRVLVTGANGQLARCIRDIEPSWNYLDRQQLDLSSKRSILDALAKYKPEIIINCAAYTNVEKAESEKQLAHTVNGHNLKFLASTGAKVIHISTDYVFSGESKSPYFTLDVPKPINVYGASKLLGERILDATTQNYSVIRTSWVYSEYGKNFFKTIYNAAKTRPALQVVDDQFGAPTYARDLAKYICGKTKQNLWINKETLHFSGKNYCTWYDFANEIVDYSNPNCSVSPVDSSKFPTIAKRPKNSRLFTHESMRPWKDSLKECVFRYKNLVNY